jgi:CheY-like chemotaxis protein
MPDSPWRALVVDDALTAAEELLRALEDAGATVRTATSAPDAIALLEEEPFDAVVVDVELPGESGLAVLDHLRGKGSQVPVLLLSLTDDSNARADAFRAGADDYLVKPYGVAEVVARLWRRRSTHLTLQGARAEAERLHALAVLGAGGIGVGRIGRGPLRRAALAQHLFVQAGRLGRQPQQARQQCIGLGLQGFIGRVPGKKAAVQHVRSVKSLRSQQHGAGGGRAHGLLHQRRLARRHGKAQAGNRRAIDAAGSAHAQVAAAGNFQTRTHAIAAHQRQ